MNQYQLSVIDWCFDQWVFTPHSRVCQIGYTDHTGCHQLVFGLQSDVSEKCQP
jgi:hypothetical protein